MKVLLLFLIFFATNVFLVRSQVTGFDVLSLGVWSNVITSTEVSLIGDDYNKTDINSVLNENILSVETTSPLDMWRITIKRRDTKWDNLIKLKIRLVNMGLGNGCNVLSQNGTFFEELNLIDKLFLTGQGNCTNIEVQLQIPASSKTLLIPIDTYNTQIVYTIIDD